MTEARPTFGWDKPEFRARMREVGVTVARQRRDAIFGGPLDAELRQLADDKLPWWKIAVRLGVSENMLANRRADLGLLPPDAKARGGTPSRSYVTTGQVVRSRLHPQQDGPSP